MDRNCFKCVHIYLMKNLGNIKGICHRHDIENDNIYSMSWLIYEGDGALSCKNFNSGNNNDLKEEDENE